MENDTVQVILEKNETENSIEIKSEEPLSTLEVEVEIAETNELNNSLLTLPEETNTLSALNDKDNSDLNVVVSIDNTIEMKEENSNAEIREENTTEEMKEEMQEENSNEEIKEENTSTEEIREENSTEEMKEENSNAENSIEEIKEEMKEENSNAEIREEMNKVNEILEDNSLLDLTPSLTSSDSDLTSLTLQNDSSLVIEDQSVLTQSNSSIDSSMNDDINNDIKCETNNNNNEVTEEKKEDIDVKENEMVVANQNENSVSKVEKIDLHFDTPIVDRLIEGEKINEYFGESIKVININQMNTIFFQKELNKFNQTISKKETKKTEEEKGLYAINSIIEKLYFFQKSPISSPPSSLDLSSLKSLRKSQKKLNNKNNMKNNKKSPVKRNIKNDINNNKEENHESFYYYYYCKLTDLKETSNVIVLEVPYSLHLDISKSLTAYGDEKGRGMIISVIYHIGQMIFWGKSKTSVLSFVQPRQSINPVRNFNLTKWKFLFVGKSANFSFCKHPVASKKKKSSPCNQIIDKSRGCYCLYHRNEEYLAVSKRRMALNLNVGAGMVIESTRNLSHATIANSKTKPNEKITKAPSLDSSKILQNLLEGNKDSLGIRNMKVKLGRLPSDTPSLLPRGELPLNKYRNDSLWRVSSLKRKRSELTDDNLSPQANKKVLLSTDENQGNDNIVNIYNNQNSNDNLTLNKEMEDAKRQEEELVKLKKREQLLSKVRSKCAIVESKK